MAALCTDHTGIEMLLGHIIQDFMSSMKQSGLSMPQIHVLMFLFHSGECQVSDIGDHMGASPAAASQLVERLVKRGLVESHEDPNNRRAKILSLSHQGLNLIHQAVDSTPRLAEVMASLSDEQRAVVHSAFDYLAQAVKQMHTTHSHNS